MEGYLRHFVDAIRNATLTLTGKPPLEKPVAGAPVQEGARFGPYELIEPVGSGAMGEVFRAIDTRLERTVAIKVLRDTHPGRFQREARAIAALNHPNVCTLYDVGPDYLVMEFVEGAPLRGPFSADEAVKLGLEIAAALEAAHEKGIIHRDLKPSNVMVTRTGVKVLDFGLAKWVDNQAHNHTATQPGTILGTPAYMSPEQTLGKPSDRRSDVFSFGSVLYEMLSGRRPFRGDTPISTMMAISTNEPEPLAAPAEISRIVARCLRKAPAERFQTMSEVRAALERTSTVSVEDKASPSIAVLPFTNLSADADNEYFSDGLAEETINRLAGTPGLKVIARTSAFAFKGVVRDIREIAEALRVRTVLEGSVRRAGDSIRVTARLINAEDGSQRWSGRYDREVTDVFAVQDEIAAAIASSMQVTLARKPGEGREHQPNLPAYEAYLKGLYHLFRNTPQSLLRSEEQLGMAGTLDPEYLAPHVALAQVYILFGLHGLRPAKEMMPLVRAEASRTLELDPAAPSGHALFGLVAAAFDYDWKAAQQRFGLATAEEPIPGMVRWPYANFGLAPRGRFREAADQMRIWLEQDPLNVAVRADYAFFLNHAGMHDRAVLAARSALELDDSYWFAHHTMCEICWALGMRNDALAAAERAYQLAPWNTRVTGMLAGILTMTGDAGRAASLRGDLERMGPTGMLVYHLVTSNIEAAAEWYAKVIEQREMFAVLYAHATLTKELRQSSHWPGLSRRINSPGEVD